MHVNAQSVSPQYFARLYRRETDPWHFASSDYEAAKYAASIAALGSHYSGALEIGCSIGVFTRALAPHCDALLGIDVAPAALRRARRRCRDLSHVRFTRAAVPDEFPNGTYDLVTFCEIGYYLHADDLRRTKERIASSLSSGGRLLLVHWTPPVSGHVLAAREVHDCFTRDDRFVSLGHANAPTYLLDVLAAA